MLSLALLLSLLVPSFGKAEAPNELTALRVDIRRIDRNEARAFAISANAVEGLSALLRRYVLAEVKAEWTEAEGDLDNVIHCFQFASAAKLQATLHALKEEENFGAFRDQFHTLGGNRRAYLVKALEQAGELLERCP